MTSTNNSIVPLSVSRRALLKSLTGAGIGSIAFQRALAAQVDEQGKVTAEMIAQAEWIAGIELEDDEREDIAKSIRETLAGARKLRDTPVDADTVPALVFRPDFFYDQAHTTSGQQPSQSTTVQVGWSKHPHLDSLSDEDLAFASISHQASLLAAKKISSRELTGLYLARLEKYDPLLKCVVTLLAEHAIEQADASDRRRSGLGGNTTRGILDGIPWVAKDLIAVPPWKTTWGAEPFQDQVRPTMATVANKLSAAGAVLMAKVTLGAMAWGDQWFGGMTRNPWNPEQGSSGSSAGSAASVAAGLASFALGSETLGSIVSPCRRCRVSGLRPTFGRVSRAGCMPLAWTLDKIGPIARHVEDLAYVFSNLMGRDGIDPTLVQRGFKWPVDRALSSLRVGLTGDPLSPTEQDALEYFKSQRVTLVDVDLSSALPTSAMGFILGTEASTVFDDAFRADRKANYGNWPETFRQAQFTPAISYLRANRLRSQLIVEAEVKFSKVDVVLGGNDLLLTNLTGHPSIVVACGSDETRPGIQLPGVVKLTAAAYKEELLLHVGHALQAALPPKPAHPPLEDWLGKLRLTLPAENPG